MTFLVPVSDEAIESFHHSFISDFHFIAMIFAPCKLYLYPQYHFDSLWADSGSSASEVL